MPDIHHELTVNASPEEVFAAISTPTGLDQWWTLTSAGQARVGSEFELGFGPDCCWRAEVSRAVPAAEFELVLVEAHDDWLGSRVGFELTANDAGGTNVRFRHVGWPEDNAHYRESMGCWSAYLGLMARAVETGETVPYGRRLDN